MAATTALAAAMLIPTAAWAGSRGAGRPAVVPPNPPGGAAARADINGDGIADIVVSSGARLTFAGDPNWQGVDRGGSVYVIPGGATLPAGSPVLVSQDSHDFVPGAGEDDDRFGQSLATGDFNGDGLADVAVGNAHESFGSTKDVGMVTVLYGKRQAPYLGLIPNGLAQIDQGQPGIPGDNEAGDLFGASLAVGDFNADGFADLAIGDPGEAIGTVAGAGGVTVVYGSGSGLAAAGSIGITEDSGGIPGTPEKNDHFGWSVATGDVTGDARDDLAITVEGEAISGTPNAWGGVELIPGSASGLNTAANSSIGVQDTGTTGHLRNVVIGKFHGGNNADVAVFADQKKGAPQFSGALAIARGAAAGISPSQVQLIDQSTAGIPGTPEENDFFAGSLAIGDLDGDGVDDLAVGSLRENAGVGTVTLLRGGGAGLLSAPGTAFDEGDPAINANPQPAEGFGYGLRILDTTGDGHPELLVTTPWEDGSLQAGTLFVVTTGLAGDSFTVTGATSYTRGDFDSPSNFGLATPFAGGSVVTTDAGEQPELAPARTGGTRRS
jgi:hypothetical protein